MLKQNDDVLKVEVYEPVTDTTYTQLIGSDSAESAVIIDVDISGMFSIDTSNESIVKDDLSRASLTDAGWRNGEVVVHGHRLHCNRFYGYLGNGTYYCNNASPQVLTNFFGSDCDWALVGSKNCLADYTGNPYCAASPTSKQAGCSKLIDHYDRFHMHTALTGN